MLSLVQNLDVFAWSPYKVPRVDLTFIMHKLNVDLLVPPKKQRSRRSAKPHVEAVKEEMEKFKRLGAIKKVFFPEWLANTVVVKKKNGKWRVCIDFTDLNRACPKDHFSSAKDRSVDGCYDRTSKDEPFGRLSELSLNHFGSRGSGENFFYNTRGKLSLHDDALWAKECRSYVSANGHTHVQGVVR